MSSIYIPETRYIYIYIVFTKRQLYRMMLEMQMWLVRKQLKNRVHVICSFV